MEVIKPDDAKRGWLKQQIQTLLEDRELRSREVIAHFEESEYDNIRNNPTYQFKQGSLARRHYMDGKQKKYRYSSKADYDSNGISEYDYMGGS